MLLAVHLSSMLLSLRVKQHEVGSHEVGSHEVGSHAAFDKHEIKYIIIAYYYLRACDLNRGYIIMLLSAR